MTSLNLDPIGPDSFELMHKISDLLRCSVNKYQSEIEKKYMKIQKPHTPETLKTEQLFIIQWNLCQTTKETIHQLDDNICDFVEEPEL